MGARNYLIEGLSGASKTSVATELQRRRHHAIHGDRELAYQGHPETGAPLQEFAHEHHIWDIGKVKSLVADRSRSMTFFCGGSRNFHHFIDLFDAVFILDADLATLTRQVASRPKDEFGGKASDRELLARLHATQEDLPKGGLRIDATQPLSRVVDTILSRCRDAG